MGSAGPMRRQNGIAAYRREPTPSKVLALLAEHNNFLRALLHAKHACSVIQLILIWHQMGEQDVRINAGIGRRRGRQLQRFGSAAQVELRETAARFDATGR